MTAGQASTRTFTATGFTTLPVAMVYTSVANSVGLSGIATSEEGVNRFSKRLVMRTVFDFLKRQGRSALLPDAVVSAIWGQLNIQMSYKQLNCQNIVSLGAVLRWDADAPTPRS
ncbi:hypothetical protein KIN20_013707 [Parelaphostrongylus tenuis]|uniref:Uncharacterized protein n=1 Tax=Parelaphostrongylus tenuis TaxID=148309 RepID=A0AAD5MWI0_PARTN|nr:hypothetical protein KIN20_013707 [Parelaphostrongylus tenuis]